MVRAQPRWLRTFCLFSSPPSKKRSCCSPFRAPAARRVREKEFLRNSLLQEKGGYYLWKDKESQTSISGEGLWEKQTWRRERLQQPLFPLAVSVLGGVSPHGTSIPSLHMTQMERDAGMMADVVQSLSLV